MKHNVLQCSFYFPRKMLTQVYDKQQLTVAHLQQTKRRLWSKTRRKKKNR